MSAFQKPSDRIGEVIGNLTLTDCLGVGAMGAVYRAQHQSLGTPYAVKILHPQFSKDRTIAERFRREAISCSRLRHPNVVFVTDFGIHDTMGIYIIMEHLQGRPMNAMLHEEQRFTTGRLSFLGQQICDALSAAHSLDIVHRDMKPDNIVVIRDTLDREQVKVLDFGVARIKQGDDDQSAEQLTRAGLVLGTPSYISPEQINRKGGDVIGPWVDIYAVGVIFYRMLTGILPFSGNTEFEIISQHLFKAPPPIENTRPDLQNTRLSQLIYSMLAKNPAERPASMADIKTMLQEAILELQDRGVEDAFDAGPGNVLETNTTTQSGLFRIRSSTSPGFTQLIQQFQLDGTESTVVQLIEGLRSVPDLPNDAFYLALFGVLSRDWLDAPIQSPQHNSLTQHLKLLLEIAFSNETDPSPSPSLEKLLRAYRDLFLIGEDREHQRPLVVALQSLSHNPLFPASLLPEWAQVRTSGTWSAIKNIMSTEIRFTRKAPNLTRTTGEHDAIPNTDDVPTPNPDELHASSAEDSSLSQKLRQDVSIKSLKSVFTHEISIFGRKKKKDS